LPHRLQGLTRELRSPLRQRRPPLLTQIHALLWSFLRLNCPIGFLRVTSGVTFYAGKWIEEIPAFDQITAPDSATWVPSSTPTCVISVRNRSLRRDARNSCSNPERQITSHSIYRCFVR
jgi:hypothetical protein